MVAADFSDVLTYIANYWDQLLTADSSAAKGWRNLVMQIGRVKTPYRPLSPNGDYFAGTQFYWDTYFTLLGLVVGGHAETARAAVDNLCYLYHRFRLLPARNSWTSLGRSQPPYLTRMAFEVYEHGGADLSWLDRVMSIAEDEYRGVWGRGGRLDSATGLSRYRPRYWPQRLTVYESGWDKSTRFAGEAWKWLIPVDLNCQLYVYEQDFAALAELLHQPKAAAYWRQAAAKRQRLIRQYFWDEKSGFYFDYNAQKGERYQLKTLAGFYPLWSGVASESQAKRMLEHLTTFEQSGGLTNTELVEWQGCQWDYPNGWSPQQYTTIMGLERYGFHKDARRLADKWLRLQATLWRTDATLWEKYDVVHRKRGLDGDYPTQPGFGWTAGVFQRLVYEFY